MKECPKCQTQHSKKGIFCSRKCANSRGPMCEELKNYLSIKLKGYKFLTRRSLPLSNEHKQKISITVTNSWTNEKRVKQSLKFKGRKLSTETKNKISQNKKQLYKDFPEKHPNRKCAGKKSFWQTALFNGIKEKYPEAEIEYDKIQGYYLDIAIPSLKVNIEYDGVFWHDIEKDRVRDEFLISKGWKIKRISSKDLNSKKSVDFPMILSECIALIKAAEVLTDSHVWLPPIKTEFNSL